MKIRYVHLDISTQTEEGSPNRIFIYTDDLTLRNQKDWRRKGHTLSVKEG